MVEEALIASRSCPALNLSLPRSNQLDRIRRAAGAAVSAPKPPFSTVTTTTMGRLGWGT